MILTELMLVNFTYETMFFYLKKSVKYYMEYQSCGYIWERNDDIHEPK